MLENTRGEKFLRSEQEMKDQDELLRTTLDLLPRLGEGWNKHNLATLTRQSMSRVLYYDMLYRQIVGKPGIICEFGVQWGAAISQLINLRGIHEPYNYTRKIVGFDTFEGFADVMPQDGENLASGVEHRPGDYAVDSGHESTLERILAYHESQAPLSHIRKFELVKGDASETVGPWLEANQHAVIAMAIFDMDLYKPTRDVLSKIKDRFFKGTVLVFDELNCEDWPGETLALQEVLGLNSVALQHFPHQPTCAWAVLD